MRQNALRVGGSFLGIDGTEISHAMLDTECSLDLSGYYSIFWFVFLVFWPDAPRQLMHNMFARNKRVLRSVLIKGGSTLVFFLKVSTQLRRVCDCNQHHQ